MRRLLRRCLSRDPEQRLRDIGDARLEIADALEAPVEEAPAGRASWRRGALASGWLLAAVAAAAWLVTSPEPADVAPAAVRRAVLPLPPGQRITDQTGLPLAIARDGRRIAYTVQEQEVTGLYIRDLDRTEARPVAGTTDAQSPFFSPDGRWVAFWMGGTVYRVRAEGGPPLRVADVESFRAGVWETDDTIVFCNDAGLFRVAASGGRPEALGPAEAPLLARWPLVLPDGRLLLEREAEPRPDGAASVEPRERIVALDPETLAEETLLALNIPVKNVSYAPTGHLLLGSAGEIVAVPFDLAASAALGPPVAVAEDLFEGTTGWGPVYFAVAEDGTLVFVDGGVSHALVLVDRAGRSRPLGPERAAFRLPAFAPDGQRVSVAIDDDPRDSNIWLYDLRGGRQRFTTEYHNLTTVWTPAGDAIAYTSGRPASSSSRPTGMIPFTRSLGSTRDRPLLPEDALTEYLQSPASFSPDGDLLVFVEFHPVRNGDLYLLDLSGPEPRVRELLVTPFEEREGQVSSDGRWLAYQSDRTGRREVYVRPFPDGGRDWLVSGQGGIWPRWAKDTGELFFRSGDSMMVVSLQDGEPGPPRELFDASGFHPGHFDVAPDGQHLVMIETDPRGSGRRIEVVFGWLAELQRLAPSR